jgi:hypothetical protein
MWVFRILFLLLLISVSMSAQSSPDMSPISPQFELRVLAVPPEFRAKSLSTPSQNGQNQIGTVPLVWLVEPSPSSPQKQVEEEPFPPEQTSTCFYIRTYRMKREDPQSDITTPAGYSECQPSAGLQLKDAVDSPR